MTNDELDAIVERLSGLPYWVVDFLPAQAPADRGQYAAVERYFLEPEHLASLRKRLAHILLRLNCYQNLWVSTDYTGEWVRNPDPHELEDLVSACVPLGDGPRQVSLVVGEGEALLTLDADDLYATLYGPSPRLLDLAQALAQTEGLCVWQPPRE